MYLFTVLSKEDKVWLEKVGKQTTVHQNCTKFKEKKWFVSFILWMVLWQELWFQKVKRLMVNFIENKFCLKFFLNLWKKGEQPLEMSCCTMTMLRHTRQQLLLNISRRKESDFFPTTYSPDL